LRRSFALLAFDVALRQGVGAAKDGMYSSSPRPWGVGAGKVVFILDK
jgi:hypothetical protein